MTIPVGWQWPLIIAFALYVVTAAAALIGRLRYERRRRLLDRVASAVAGGSANADRVLSGASARQVRRLAFEVRSSHVVDELVARFVARTVGFERLSEIATGRRRTSRWRRVSALRVLALAAPHDAIAALDTGTRASDTEVVAAAVRLLGGMRTERAAATLVEVLRSGRYPRSRVATFLDRFAVDVPTVIEPLLADGAAINRFWGAVLLHRYAATPWVEEQLVRLARDASGPVRKAAIQSLAAAGTTTAVHVAAEGLHDNVWFVRAHAARALGALGASEHAGAVAALLAEPRWWVREAAADALVQMGTGAEAAVIACLSHEDRFARNRAAEVLQNLGTIERLLVEEAIGPSAPVRRDILLKVREAGGPTLAHAVLRGLPEDLRVRARSALRTMGTAAGT